MKKTIYSLLITSIIFIVNGSANSNKNIQDINLPKEFSQSKVITEEDCRNFLGEDNYNFIIEVYNDKMIPMLKCKEEMRK
jgi:hypothetical protein